MSFLQRLWQEGYLSFDKPVQDYVPEFPEKHFDGEKVKIYFMLHTHMFSCNLYIFPVGRNHFETFIKSPVRYSSLRKGACASVSQNSIRSQ